jgi:exodeoxyribonuclease III
MKTTTEDLRVISWNVNGIRARWPRVIELLTGERPDVVCLQETRCSEWHFPRERLREMGYHSRHSPGRQQGGGVAILVREDHAITDRGMDLDRRRRIAEGHWIELTTEGITIGSVYVPAGRAPGERSDAGKRAFLEAVARQACDEHSHPLLIAGDFNVAPTDSDVYEPAWFEDSYQTGEAERADLRAILDEGELVDVYRALHPDERGYTCWEQREGHYGRDYGLRIDLILASEALAPYIGACEVNHAYRRGFRPSNHAPLDVELQDVHACARCLSASEEYVFAAREELIAA